MKRIKVIGLALTVIGLASCTNSRKTGYYITDFGAVGDSVTLCTEAINKAIAVCSAKGGGRVVVPTGKFKSGTIQMKSNVELHLDAGATLVASTNHADFPRQAQPAFRSQKDPGGWFALIYAEKESNIAITGQGTIDGNGRLQMPHTVEGAGNNEGDKDARPRNILFISCSHIRIEGIKMHNSGIWNQHYLDCEDVLIDRVEVYNHSNRNNDALDFDGCRRAILSNSIFDTDDDGITLKSTGAAACEDIVITNCIISSFSNAIKAGTESTGGFRNVTISNCVIRPSHHPSMVTTDTYRRGITGISLEIVDGGIMEGVSVDNVVIEETEAPLYIRLGNRARKHTDSAPAPPMGQMRNIRISNLTAYNTGNFSSSISSIPGSYIENVMLDNIQLFNTGGLAAGDYIASHTEVVEDEKGYPQPTVWKNLPSSVLFIRHVKNISVNNLIFGSKDSDPRIPVIASDVKNLRIKNSTFSGHSTPAGFALLDRVEGHDIEKPSGWNKAILIQK